MQLWEAFKPIAGVFASIYAIPLAVAFETVMFAMDGTLVVVNSLATTFQGLAGALTEATQAVTPMVDLLVDKLGLKKPKLVNDIEETRTERDVQMGIWAGNQAIKVDANRAANRPKLNTDKGKEVTVVLKWDLGDGNEEAIYIRSRRDINEMLRKAQSFVRTGPRLPGGG
jgi:hypothetical protein